MIRSLRFFCLGGMLLLANQWIFAAETPPLRALLVTGGCCHDYPNQKRILTGGITARANVAWTVVHEGDHREHQVSIYTNAAWARGFDVVAHNECFGFVTNNTLIETITAAHREGVPGLVLHCSAHSYRNATTDEWRKFLGVSSVRHGANHAFEVVNLQPAHPVMRGFPERWPNAPDELYQILTIWPDAIPLGQGVSAKEPEQVCVWVNTYGRARVFGTTLGHSNVTMEHPVFLDLVTRGLLWVCGRLGDDGLPRPGYGPK